MGFHVTGFGIYLELCGTCLRGNGILSFARDAFCAGTGSTLFRGAGAGRSNSCGTRMGPVRVCAGTGFRIYHGTTGYYRIPPKTAGKVLRNALKKMERYVFVHIYVFFFPKQHSNPEKLELVL